MRRLNAILASSAIAVACTLTGSVRAADSAPGAPANPPANAPANAPMTDNMTNTMTDTARTAADTAKNNMDKMAVAAPAADSIRKTVAEVTQYALTKDGYKDVTSYFVDADHTRLKSFAPSDNFAKLNGRIDQFQKDWKSKYNQDFSFASNRKDVLSDSFARISQGEIGEARTASGTVASDQPNVVAGSAEDLKKSGAANTDANSNKTFGGETKKEAGRNIASFIVPASAGMPELDVAMIHELPSNWRIDVPDTVDGQKLYDNLINHITMVDEDRANWPADVNDAYRVVTRHILAAVEDSTMTK